MADWLLALDTSTPLTALALGRVDRAAGAATLARQVTFDDSGAPASASLAPRIAGLLAEVGIAARDVGAVACGRGPGMFTGCRVALATAKGLALGRGCPIFGISTLAALAGAEALRGPVLALLDARRGDVYAAAFAGGPRGLVRLTEDRCCTIGQVLEDMPPALRAEIRPLGPGVVAYAEALPADLRARARATAGVEAEGLWSAAATAALFAAPDDLAGLDAIYLRASYAELGLNTPKRPPYRSPFV